MSTNKLLKSSLVAAAITLGASAAYAAAPQLLLDFQFNEGQGLTSKSSVGNTVLTLGEAVDPSWTPVGTVDSPSGAAGDLALDVTTGHGWLYTELEENPIDLTKPFSWESWVWVDPDNTKQYEDFFRLGNAIKVGTDNKHLFELTFCGVVDIPCSWEVGRDGSWIHLALSWEPGVGVYYYVNGEWVDEVYTESMPNKLASNILTIAADNSGASIFQGKLDRMRFHQGIPADIYSPDNYFDCDPANPKPLSADTVLAFDFNEATVPFKSSTKPEVSMASGPEVIGISTQIQFAETTPVRDAKPEVTDDFSVFVDNSGASSARKYGKFDTDTINFGDTSDSSFTLEAWFKGLARSEDKQVFFQTWSSTGGTVPRLSFAIYKDFTVYFTTMARRDIYTGAKIPEDGGWHHVAVSFDQPNKKIKAYVDGQLVSETARNNTATGAVLSSDDDFAVDFTSQGDDTNVGMIGAEHSGACPFTGYVDRMRFWKGVVAQEDLDYQYYGEVINPPQFSTQPTSYEVQPGTPVKLSAKVVGTDTDAFPMSYQWYKDGEAIEGATSLDYVVEVTEETLGAYTVKASNAKNGQGGEATSEEATLSFSKATPKAPKMLIDFGTTEGKGVTTASSVGGLVASLGTEYVYNPDTDANVIVSDSFFGSKDTVMKSVGKSWLTGTYDGAILDKSKPFTLETWVYIDPDNDKTFEGYIVVDGSVKIGTDANHNFEMTFYGVKDVMSGLIVPAGQWQHYAASYDPNAIGYNDAGEEVQGVVYFYLDGGYMGEVAQAEGPNEGGGVVRIGGESGWPMWGSLNRCRVHQGMPSDPYNAFDYLDCDPQNPKPVKAETVLSYSFDTPEFPQVNEVGTPIELYNSGQEYADDQNAKNVQWSNLNPAGAEDAYSLVFSNSKQADYGNADYLVLDSADPSYTVEAWVKTTKASSRQVLFANDGPGARFSFSVNSDMTVHSTTYGVKDYETSASIPDDGDWHHVAFILDWQSEWVYAYVDGVLSYMGDVYVDGSGNAMRYDSGTARTFLGSEGTGNYFTGNLTRVRVHSGVVAAKDLDYYNIDKGTAPEIVSLSIPEVVAGEEAILSVKATGKEPMAYQWYKNGAAIDGATEAVYVIEEATMADGGSYSVTVSNAIGDITSETVIMPVASAAADLATILNFQFDEGQGLKFASQEGGAVGYLDEPIVSVGISEGVSGLIGDSALDLKGGYLKGQFPEETIEYAKGSLAFESWVFSTSDIQYQDFFRFGGSLKVGLTTGGYLQMTLLGVADITSGIVVPKNEWVHLAVFFEAGKGATFFVNGEMAEFVECTGSAKAITDPVFTLGAANDGGSTFVGKLDRLRLAFTNSLTEEDLDSDPANPRDAEGVIEWSFNGTEPYTSQGVMEIALDPVEGAVPATWTFGPYDGDGDSALYFQRQGVTFDSSNINFGDTSDKSFSIEAWVNMNEVNARQILFATPGNDNGTCPSISVSVLNSGELRVTTMGIADFNTGVIIPRDGAWHNIAAAWNQPAGAMFVFIDGKVAGSKAYTGGVNFSYPGWWGSNPTNTGFIGCEANNGSPLTGSIDRLKIWKGVVGSANLDYPAGAPVPPEQPVELNWFVEGNVLTLSWETGSLEVSSDNVNWVTIDQVSPLSIDLSTTEGNKFYRIAK